MIMIEIEKEEAHRMGNLARNTHRALGQIMNFFDDCCGDEDSYNERDDRYEDEPMRGGRYRREDRDRGYDDDGFGERRGRYRRPSRY